MKLKIDILFSYRYDRQMSYLYAIILAGGKYASE